MYPFEKYRYYTNGKKVIAISTYAGKTVRGVATCNPADTFDLEKGKKLAALRCAEKIAMKRFKRAEDKLDGAEVASIIADSYVRKMNKYYSDAVAELNSVQSKLVELTKSL